RTSRSTTGAATRSTAPLTSSSAASRARSPSPRRNVIGFDTLPPSLYLADSVSARLGSPNSAVRFNSAGPARPAYVTNGEGAATEACVVRRDLRELSAQNLCRQRIKPHES